jgi:hypothetical protein
MSKTGLFIGLTCLLSFNSAFSQVPEDSVGQIFLIPMVQTDKDSVESLIVKINFISNSKKSIRVYKPSKDNKVYCGGQGLKLEIEQLTSNCFTDNNTDCQHIFKKENKVEEKTIEYGDTTSYEFDITPWITTKGYTFKRKRTVLGVYRLRLLFLYISDTAKQKMLITPWHYVNLDQRRDR